MDTEKLQNLQPNFQEDLGQGIHYWKLNDLWPIVGAHAFVDLVEFA
jgi:hypothetical protein